LGYTPPPVIVSAIRDHLTRHVGDGPDTFVFTGPAGRPIWRGNFNKLTRWPEAVEKIGKAGLHFHDLRHTGNTLAARTGASTRDLMARMGHDSPQAVMIYQHATSEADRAIADALNAAVQHVQKQDQKKARKAAKKLGSKKPDKAKKARRQDPDDGAAGAPDPAS
jgi:hypothetical protein